MEPPIVGRGWYGGYLYGAGGAIADPCWLEIEDRPLEMGPVVVGECWLGEDWVP